MDINDIAVPNNVQGFTIDLWDTLFYDSHYVNELNNIRKNIIDEVLCNNKVSIDILTKDAIVIERKRFQNFEKKGKFLPISERLHFITNNKLSDNEIRLLAEKLDVASTMFVPKLNFELLTKLRQWKNKYKLALISNTGMTSSLVIKDILNSFDIYDLFDEIIFSEDVGFCKPNAEIFYLASKRLNISKFNLLHIGDSILFDFNAAKNAGLYAIRVEGNEYFKSW